MNIFSYYLNSPLNTTVKEEISKVKLLESLSNIASTSTSPDKDIIILLFLNKYFEGMLSSREIVTFIPFLRRLLTHPDVQMQRYAQSLIALDPNLDGLSKVIFYI